MGLVSLPVFLLAFRIAVAYALKCGWDPRFQEGNQDLPPQRAHFLAYRSQKVSIGCDGVENEITWALGLPQ